MVSALRGHLRGRAPGLRGVDVDADFLEEKTSEKKLKIGPGVPTRQGKECAWHSE